jgi:hypothetical protein
MTHNDLSSGRDKMQPAGADPVRGAGSQGGESGNGQMQPHTRPERTGSRAATTLQGYEDPGGENGPTYQTGGTQQDRADEVEERKQDGS